jgi:hypothetical protein
MQMQTRRRKQHTEATGSLVVNLVHKFYIFRMCWQEFSKIQIRMNHREAQRNLQNKLHSTMLMMLSDQQRYQHLYSYWQALDCVHVL